MEKELMDYLNTNNPNYCSFSCLLGKTKRKIDETMPILELLEEFEFLKDFFKKYEYRICDFLFSRKGHEDCINEIYDSLELYLDVDTPIDKQVEIITEFYQYLGDNEIKFRKIVIDVSN